MIKILITGNTTFFGYNTLFLPLRFGPITLISYMYVCLTHYAHHDLLWYSSFDLSLELTLSNHLPQQSSDKPIKAQNKPHPKTSPTLQQQQFTHPSQLATQQHAATVHLMSISQSPYRLPQQNATFNPVLSSLQSILSRSIYQVFIWINLKNLAFPIVC